MKLSVTQNKIEITEKSTVNQGEVNATTCEFEFTSPYKNLAKKAIFTDLASGAAYEVPILGDQCSIPNEVLGNKGVIAIGVYAYEVTGEVGEEKLKLRYSPTPVRINIELGSYKSEVTNPSDVTPSQTEIYEAQIQAGIHDINEAVQDLEEKVATDYFKGDKGDQGDPGVDGVGIASIEKTGTSGLVDTYTITLTDGHTADFTVSNGEKGDTGEKGEQGDPGADGVNGEDGVGIASAVLNDDYTLTLTFTDETTYTTPPIKGETGAQGEPGQNGQDATITVGTTAVNFGQDANSVVITNSGTASAAKLDFEFNFNFADGNDNAY